MKLPRTIFAGALVTIVVAALFAQEDASSDSGQSTQSIFGESGPVGSSDGITIEGSSGTSGAATGTVGREEGSGDGVDRVPPGLPAEGISPAGVRSQWQAPVMMGKDTASMMMRRGGQAPDLGRQFRDVNQECVQIARRYRDLAEREPSSPQLENERQSLVNAVAAAFDVRQRWQQDEVARLQERLKRLESTIASRNRARNQIIERRVTELINPEQVWGEGPADSRPDPIHPLTRGMLPPDAGSGDESRQNDAKQRQVLSGTSGQPSTGRMSSESKRNPSTASRREGAFDLFSNDVRANRQSSIPSSGPEQDFQFLIESVDALAKARTALAESESSLENEHTNIKRWQRYAQSDPNSVGAGKLRSAEETLHGAQYQKRRAEDELKKAVRQERQARQALETRIKLLQIDVTSAELQLTQARREEDRARSLKERNAITPSELEEKQTASLQAKLAVEKAETLLNAARQALKAADEIAQPAPDTGTRFDRGSGTAPPDSAPTVSRDVSGTTPEGALELSVPRSE